MEVITAVANVARSVVGHLSPFRSRSSTLVPEHAERTSPVLRTFKMSEFKQEIALVDEATEIGEEEEEEVTWVEDSAEDDAEWWREYEISDPDYVCSFMELEQEEYDTFYASQHCWDLAEQWDPLPCGNHSRYYRGGRGRGDNTQQLRACAEDRKSERLLRKQLRNQRTLRHKATREQRRRLKEERSPTRRPADQSAQAGNTVVIRGTPAPPVQPAVVPPHPVLQQTSARRVHREKPQAAPVRRGRLSDEEYQRREQEFQRALQNSRREYEEMVRQQERMAREASSAAAGPVLTFAQVQALMTRDLTPEDYEMLLRLDEAVEKKHFTAVQCEQLWVVGPGSGGQCLVCQTEVQAAEVAAKLRQCGHEFHRECIHKWLTTSSVKCPADNVELKL